MRARKDYQEQEQETGLLAHAMAEIPANVHDYGVGTKKCRLWISESDGATL